MRAAGEHAVRFDPEPERWGALLTEARRANAQAKFLGRSADAWRELTRRELGVPADKPVLATGHEAVLWHPGILAKYIALNAWAKYCGAACVHLVVDQHVGGFDSLEVPVRRVDGELAVASVSLGKVRPHVPMGWHPPLEPPEMRTGMEPALPSVRTGIERILELVRANRDAPNAAAQMGRVLDELLKPWFPSIPGVTASALMQTTLARAMIEAMVADVRRMAQHYNEAVANVPEAGIGGLSMLEDQIELPLWRIDADGLRKRAFNHDARVWLENPNAFALLPRALTMTALLRLGACDVFIHGFGGARYDPAMESWITSWLGVTPQPIAMVSATLRLPLEAPNEVSLDEKAERHRARHAWHDPAASDRGTTPSTEKQRFLDRLASAPRNSNERRTLFLEMHETLEALRHEHRDIVEAAQQRHLRAERQLRERDIVERRTWPFPFYPRKLIDEMAETISKRVTAGCAGAAPTTSVRSPAP